MGLLRGNDLHQQARNGELTRDSLPAYVTEGRLAIQEMQQERKLKEAVTKELEVLKDKLSAKDLEAKPPKLSGFMSRSRPIEA